MDKKDLDKLIETEREADLELLINAKNVAKEKLKESPTKENLVAFEKARQMLERELSGDQQGNLFKNRAQALLHLQEKGYKVQKTKFYNDVKSGLCHMNPDGRISEGALNRYVQHPGSGLIQNDAVEDQDGDLKELIRREKELSVENLEIKKKREQFNMEKEMGLWILHSDVDMELVSRAIALKSHLKHKYTIRATELSRLSPSELLRNLLSDLDETLTEFANTSNYHVILTQEEGI
jgi:hypothetical protein